MHRSIIDPTALLSGVFVFGAAESDVARQPPARGNDGANTRYQSLNVSLIRPMKKIIATLTIIVAAALGAQGQTTNTFPVGSGAETSFTGLTFDTGTFTPPPPAVYARARLLFGVTGFTIPSRQAVYFDSITLSGQGIPGSPLSGFGEVAVAGNLVNPGDILQYTASATVDLTTTLESWDSSSNLTGFLVDVYGTSFANPGARIYYAVQYADANGGNINTAFGNSVIVAVPEPSTYVAAAGLLGLFLWSARRHLCKLTISHSASSGSSAHEAA